MNRNPNLLILVLFLSAQLANPQSIMDLKGTWNIGHGKHGFTVFDIDVASVQLDFTGQSRAVYESIKTVSSAGERTFTLRYLTDGSATINEFAGHQVSSRAWWQGNRLVIQWKWQGSKSGVQRIFSVNENNNKEMLIQYFEPGRIDMKTVSLEKKR